MKCPYCKGKKPIILGVPHDTLRNHKRYGWSDERIINTPIQVHRKVV